MKPKSAVIFLLIGFAMGQLPMYLNAAKIDTNEFQNTGFGVMGLVVSTIVALTCKS